MFRTFILAAALVASPAFAAFKSDRISVTTQGSGPDVVLVHGDAIVAIPRTTRLAARGG